MAQKKSEEKTYFELKNWEVEKVREVKRWGVFFTLKVDGAAFYNMRLIDGKKGKYDDFIACPEEKGSDGNYYKIFNLFLDPEDVKEVVAEVRKQLK